MEYRKNFRHPYPVWRPPPPPPPPPPPISPLAKNPKATEPKNTVKLRPAPKLPKTTTSIPITITSASFAAISRFEKLNNPTSNTTNTYSEEETTTSTSTTISSSTTTSSLSEPIRTVPLPTTTVTPTVQSTYSSEPISTDPLPSTTETPKVPSTYSSNSMSTVPISTTLTTTAVPNTSTDAAYEVSHHQLPASLQPFLQRYNTDVCRNFLWGLCTKISSECRYNHVLDIAIMKRTLKFCHDYQNGCCSGIICTYLHASSEEEREFRVFGKIPSVLMERYAKSVENIQVSSGLSRVNPHQNNISSSCNHLGFNPRYPAKYPRLQSHTPYNHTHKENHNRYQSSYGQTPHCRSPRCQTPYCKSTYCQSSYYQTPQCQSSHCQSFHYQSTTRFTTNLPPPSQPYTRYPSNQHSFSHQQCNVQNIPIHNYVQCKQSQPQSSRFPSYPLRTNHNEPNHHQANHALLNHPPPDHLQANRAPSNHLQANPHQPNPIVDVSLNQQYTYSPMISPQTDKNVNRPTSTPYQNGCRSVLPMIDVTKPPPSIAMKRKLHCSGVKDSPANNHSYIRSLLKDKTPTSSVSSTPNHPIQSPATSAPVSNPNINNCTEFTRPHARATKNTTCTECMYWLERNEETRQLIEPIPAELEDSELSFNKKRQSVVTIKEILLYLIKPEKREVLERFFEEKPEVPELTLDAALNILEYIRDDWPVRKEDFKYIVNDLYVRVKEDIPDSEHLDEMATLPEEITIKKEVNE